MKITFTETSPRRLVYFLSITYLLESAISTFLDLPWHAVSEKPILIPDFLLGAKKKYKIDEVMRIIRFLSQHKIINFDESSQNLSMTSAMKQALSKYIKLNYNKKYNLVAKCNFKFSGNQFVLSGSPDVIFATLNYFDIFCRSLHVANRLMFFDAVNNGVNTLFKVDEHFSKSEDTLSNSFKSVYKSAMLPGKELAKGGSNLNKSILYLIFTDLERFGFIKSVGMENYQDFNDYFTENAPGYYILTELGHYLRSDHPDSLSPTLNIVDEAWWNTLKSFKVSLDLANTKSSFELANGKSFYEYLQENESIQKGFNKGLACLNKNQDHAFVSQLRSNKYYDLKNYYRIIDIAGGAGGLLSTIEKEYPKKFVLTLYDKASVIADVKKDKSKQHLKLIEGDFFKASPNNKIPKDQQLYMMRGTLHNFKDNECITILSHIRENMNTKGTFFVIERILPKTEKPYINYYGDLMMMMLLNGKGRHAEQYWRMFLLAGLIWENRHNPMFAEDHSIMVCKPYTPEIPRGISFLKQHKEPKQSNSFRIIQLINLCKSRLEKDYFNNNLNTEVISQGFNKAPLNYHPDYFHLCQSAITTNKVKFLQPISYEALSKVKINTKQYQQNYLFLPLYRCHQGLYQWSSVLIDCFAKTLYFIDPNGLAMPNKLITVLSEKLDININKERCFFHPQKRSAVSKQYSGVVLIGLCSVITQQIATMDNLPKATKAVPHWYASLFSMINPLNAKDITAMFKQQLRWNLDFLDEIKPFDKSLLQR